MANLYVKYNGLVMGPLDDPDDLCCYDGNPYLQDYAPDPDCGYCAIPTPYVTRSERIEYSGKISYRVTDINISGKVYADDTHITANTEFSTIDLRRNAILSAFSD